MKSLQSSLHPSIWILFILSSLLFVLYPQIDIEFSSLFYDANEKFYLAHKWWVLVIYHSVKYFIIFSLVVAIGVTSYNYFKNRSILNMTGKKLAFLLLVLALGPGLIVNWVFKENFGRARPQNTEIFGASKAFTPAFVISSECETNCSFSCGHASGAFFAIALALLATKRKKLYLSLAIVYGFLVGLGRVIQGGHYLSDVIVSFFVVFIVSKIIYYFMFEKIRVN